MRENAENRASGLPFCVRKAKLFEHINLIIFFLNNSQPGLQRTKLIVNQRSLAKICPISLLIL